MITKKYKYRFIEDNGGKLQLFILDEQWNIVDAVFNLEYAPEGTWNEIKDDLNNDPLGAAGYLEGHWYEFEDLNVEELYHTYMTDDLAGKIVAKDGILYPERMGVTAELFFGIKK